MLTGNAQRMTVQQVRHNQLCAVAHNLYEAESEYSVDTRRRATKTQREREGEKKKTADGAERASAALMARSAKRMAFSVSPASR